MNVPPPDNAQSIALAWLSLGSQAGSARREITTRVLVLKPVNLQGNPEVPRSHAEPRPPA